MNSFAKILDSMIIARGLSNNKAAKMCDMDTSLLRRYRKSERIPRNEKIFDKLKNGLNLSEKEYDDLCDSFHKVKASINGFYDLEKVHLSDQKKLITALENRSDHSIASMSDCHEYLCDRHDFKETLPMMISIHNMDELSRCIAFLYEYASQYHRMISVCSFYTFMEKRNRVDQFTICKNVDTEHLLLFNNASNSEEIISAFLEHKGLCHPDGHHLFHISQNLTTILREHSSMIFTDHFLLKYSYLGDKVSGILTQDPSIVTYYKKLYHGYKEDCIYHSEDIYDVFLNYLKK